MVKIDRAAHTSGDLISKISELEAKRLKMSGAVRTQPYVLFGLGGVGRGLLRALLDASDKHQAQYGVGFAALALCDSRGALGDCKAAIAPAAVRAAHDAKEAGGELASAGPAYVARGAGVSAADFLEGVVDSVLGAGHADAIIVDCTATEDTIPALLKAVEAGLKVVSANKKPFASEQSVFERLTSAGSPFKQLSKVRHESSVGAGLPVITALTRTVAADDPISRINGTFSGTLGYVMTGLQAGEPLSSVVLEAKRLGYTEPDPRDDLGGVDVARKALILARLMGWRLEMSDVTVEPLYPPEMASLTVDEFLAALPSLDAPFAAKCAAAAEAGEVLRYAAAIADGALKVSLVSVSVDTPLGRLAGTDNLVEVYTQWYEKPLVIQGAGAGVGTTAAGVLADMVELAFTK